MKEPKSNIEIHINFSNYCKLIISMSVDAIEKRSTYNTYIGNLEVIIKQMRENFYIKDKKENY